MTFIPHQTQKNCFAPCDKQKVDSGLCDCNNRMKSIQITMAQEQEKAKWLSELELAKKQITDNIKWTTEERKPSGGQTCGMPTIPVVLISEELNFSVKIGWHRSQLKNREIAFMLFQLALDEFVK